MRSLRKARLRAGSMGAAGVALVLALTACGGSGDAGNEADGTLKVWAHSGQASEAEALQDLVDQFNDANEDITVELTLVPEADYTSTIQATKAEDLPDIMEMDAPTWPPSSTTVSWSRSRGSSPERFWITGSAA